ncbi:uncharacterized protein BJ212DRAFT_1298235 [Suillus subaureus]|uniref:Uncharacterized protein n=1 Tax=Suillus subaureus TaxID=48587 RepID=A0A9P7EEY3_9AGAM|nr:uncharacterized protein BJ212DRAFT_1298235 [Suillus subaureus]KAG1819828.1 hypothetical protein BJ212DRAFT_1298235 [Suillus subaureus]
MAHTKNTTKKCTGGSVPCILLKISRVKLSGGDYQEMKASSTTRGALPVGGGDLEKRNGQHEALTATSDDLEMRSAHNKYCILCKDGAECYEDNTLFMCICCHIKIEQSATYFGFYTSNSLPFLDKFLSITSALEVSAKAEISAAPVIFIHLILVDFEVAGSPFEFAHSFLKPYYCGDGIKYIEVYYDSGTDGLKNSFIWERVVISMKMIQRAILISWLARGCCLSWDLGSHSDIFLLTTIKEGSLSISRFAWVNVEVCPWGNPLPIQCSGYGRVNSWRSAYVKDSKTYIFECKNDSYKSVLDEHKVTYVSAKGNTAKRATILKTIKNTIVETDQAKNPSIILPDKNFRKFLEDDEDQDLKEKIIQEGHKLPSGPGIVTVDMVRD